MDPASCRVSDGVSRDWPDTQHRRGSRIDRLQKVLRWACWTVDKDMRENQEVTLVMARCFDLGEQ